MVYDFVAELGVFLLPVLLLALVLVHLAQNGIFLIGLWRDCCQDTLSDCGMSAKADLPRPEPHSQRSCEVLHSRL